MEKVELTIWRTVKVLWSFVWRTWVASIGLTLALYAVSWIARTILPPDILGWSILVLIVPLAVGFLFLHILIFRAALRVKWSDFELVPISTYPPGARADVDRA